MANNFFQFKQFRIEQSLSAMKVCTEACLFGALIQTANPKRILDIGTGTGLLSLMLAQRYNTPIDAVEIEENAYQQAKFNFNKSPWADQLTVFHDKIQQYAIHCTKRYNLIVTNPPFFTRHLTSSTASKNLALHNNSLSHQELLNSIDSLLSPEGTAYILMPPFEAEQFGLLAKQVGIFLNKRIQIFHSPTASALRYVSAYGYTTGTPSIEQITIRNSAGEYSREFSTLLKPYYLYL